MLVTLLILLGCIKAEVYGLLMLSNALNDVS